MGAPAGHSCSGLITATVGFLTGVLGGILWYPRLYVAIPVVVVSCVVYAAFAVLLLRQKAQEDPKLYQKLSLLSLALVAVLTGFAIAGTYLATTFCGLSTYTEWMAGGMNPCGVCISGNVFLWTAVAFWTAASTNTVKTDRDQRMQAAEKSWGDDTTVVPAV